MNEERNPSLERLFADSQQALEDEAFVYGVMAGARSLKRRRRIVLMAVCLAAVPAAWFVTAPLNDLVRRLFELMAQPVVEVGGNFAALEGLNNLGSVLGVGALVLFFAYRRLFA